MNSFQRVTLLYVVSNLNAAHNVITNHVQHTLGFIFALKSIKVCVCVCVCVFSFINDPTPCKMAPSVFPLIAIRGLPV